MRSLFEGYESGIKRADHIGVRPLRVVVPVMDGSDGLPFESHAGFPCTQLKLAAGASDCSKGAEAARQNPMRRYRGAQPGASKSALAPASLIGDQLASQAEHGEAGADALRPPGCVPSRNGA